VMVVGGGDIGKDGCWGRWACGHGDCVKFVMRQSVWWLILLKHTPRSPLINHKGGETIIWGRSTLRNSSADVDISYLTAAYRKCTCSAQKSQLI